MNPLRIALDARLRNGEFGGVQQVIIGLADEFSRFAGDAEEYYFLTYSDEGGWLEPYLSGACRPLPVGKAPPPYQVPPVKAWVFRHLPWARGVWHRLKPGRPAPVPRSEGLIENRQIGVMHFTLQTGFLTDIPSIYQPHDLQHV